MATTREQLIAVGERLFAEFGIEGVSLRQISAEGGQGNNNAVQYHFGSKEGLVEAILMARLERIDARRSALMAAADARGRSDDVRSLLEVMLLPLAEELADPDSHYVSLLAQLFYLGQRPDHPVGSAHDRALHATSGSGVAAADKVRALIDWLPAPLLRQRTNLVFSLFVHTLADRERSERASPSASRISHRLLVADLLDAGEALVRGVTSEATMRVMTAADLPAEPVAAPRSRSGRRG